MRVSQSLTLVFRAGSRGSGRRLLGQIVVSSFGQKSRTSNFSSRLDLNGALCFKDMLAYLIIMVLESPKIYLYNRIIYLLNDDALESEKFTDAV